MRLGIRKGAVLVVVIVAFLLSQELIVFSQESQEQFYVPEVFEYPVLQGRDPFYPLVHQEKVEVVEKKPLPVITQSEYQVLGIVWQDEKSVAFIAKGKKTWVVKEGMSIEGLRVSRISGDKGEVILIGEDAIIKLKTLKELGEIK